ncbi:carbamoyltransferase HypF [Motiliproteus sediminis]|uniref:carbamoyltransferase HypF n=1 Tax=Motiliproteus sediminis TaxID=1468178 RepID=UPI001AEFB1EF|nr:carbamoyltransferase HypF [Motiliproteus sediminis]
MRPATQHSGRVAGESLQGCLLRLGGQVQGVGFRPFVHNLAERLGVIGQVSNDAAGVLIEAWADGRTLDHFAAALIKEAPPMALVDALSREPLDRNQPAQPTFTIAASGGGEVSVGVTPDANVCPECLQELFDPTDRRYRYPFINCTHCGPRYSLIRALPYDRPNTTMSAFALCGRCDSEYRDPTDRRFHAQPTCCADCGPQLELRDARGRITDAKDPIAATVRRLLDGEIVAIKGLGGYHLVCDARNPAAVARLRERKQREEKPFAVMGANLASLRQVARVNAANSASLCSSVAPIVLCPRQPNDTLIGIAPGLSWLGLMLPHTPLHYLLFHQAAGQPAGMEWLQQPQKLLLVMTSGNRSGEPLVTDNPQALDKLAGIADAWLLHDRDIHTRCDDSVLHGGSEPPTVIRRGRGLAPRVVALNVDGPPVLALGPYFKNTLCVTKSNRAYVSQYVGDLDNADNCRTLEQTASQLAQLMAVEPALIAIDRHPDFYSSRLGQQLARERGLPLVRVQHHHAHIAAVMAEHQLDGAVLGLALDGTGLGDDNQLWGGELLQVEGASYQRLSGLAPLPLVGGDRAAKEPWRLGAAVLHQLGLGDQIERRFASQPGADLIRQMLERGSHCPYTSSMGRWFDAAAGLLGIKPVVCYEAQAAMMLEGLAESYGPATEESLRACVNANGELDLLPLMARLLDVADPAEGAALFQQQLVGGLSRWTLSRAQQAGLNRVVLAGGCFLNQALRRQLSEALRQQGLQVFTAERLPCNDGGISLGQAWVALQQWQQPPKTTNPERVTE